VVKQKVAICTINILYLSLSKTEAPLHTLTEANNKSTQQTLSVWHITNLNVQWRFKGKVKTINSVLFAILVRMHNSTETSKLNTKLWLKTAHRNFSFSKEK
jgi:hypothetical protein